MTDIFPACKKTRKSQDALLVLATCHVTLIQSTQYAIVENLGAACLGPQQS